jgi:hypothetical protein
MNHDSYNQAATYGQPSTHGAQGDWCDFNDADAQQGEFNLIPKGTQALVRMAIKPGGYDDASKGWTGGYATASDETGAVFLSCEFVLLTGPFAKRKIWSNVGLHSNKGPTWAQMGRSFIKAMLNSSRNIHPDDDSPRHSVLVRSAASVTSMVPNSQPGSALKKMARASTATSSGW